MSGTRWCERCAADFTPEDGDPDCSRCGDSSWPSREMCVAFTAARAFAAVLADVPQELRGDAMGELGLVICLNCYAVRDYAKEPCCAVEAEGRKRLETFSAILFRAQEAAYKAAEDPK